MGSLRGVAEELGRLLGSSRDNIEKATEIFSSNVSDHTLTGITVNHAVRSLRSRAPDGAAFDQQVAKLREKLGDNEANRLISTLMKISHDRSLLSSLTLAKGKAGGGIFEAEAEAEQPKAAAQPNEGDGAKVGARRSLTGRASLLGGGKRTPFSQMRQQQQQQKEKETRRATMEPTSRSGSGAPKVPIFRKEGGSVLRSGATARTAMPATAAATAEVTATAPPAPPSHIPATATIVQNASDESSGKEVEEERSTAASLPSNERATVDNETGKKRDGEAADTFVVRRRKDKAIDPDKYEQGREGSNRLGARESANDSRAGRNVGEPFTSGGERKEAGGEKSAAALNEIKAPVQKIDGTAISAKPAEKDADEEAEETIASLKEVESQMARKGGVSGISYSDVSTSLGSLHALLDSGLSVSSPPDYLARRPDQSMQRLVRWEDLSKERMMREREEHKDGQWVIASPPRSDLSFDFIIDKHVPPPLAESVQRLCPLANAYVRVCTYVERECVLGRGKIANAVAGAMRSLLHQYYVLIAQMETKMLKGELTMSKLYYYIQPSMKTMATLDGLIREIEASPVYTGGAVLNIVEGRMQAVGGDPISRKVLMFVLEHASRPFFHMLNTWMAEGMINDPYHEFMVEEDAAVADETSEDFWQRRYTIQADQVPSIVDSCQDEILLAGKYLNAIRHVGGKAYERVQMRAAALRSGHTDADSCLISFTADTREVVRAVQKAFNYASKELLQLLVIESDLKENLRYLHSYFLLGKGDFLVHFLDSAGAELSQPVHSVQMQRLETLLDLAMRTCGTQEEVRDLFSTKLLRYRLVEMLARLADYGDLDATSASLPDGAHRDFLPSLSADAEGVSLADAAVRDAEGMTGLEAFTLDVSLRWPLSLVVNSEAKQKYQILFRHLLWIHHIDTLLESAWVDHQATKVLSKDMRSKLVKTFALRQKMVHFIQTMQNYIYSEVLEPAWHTLARKLTVETTINGVLQVHKDYLNVCLRECLLRDNELLKGVLKLLALCNLFAKQTQQWFAAFREVASTAREGDDGLESKKKNRGQRRQEWRNEKMRNMTEAIDSSLSSSYFDSVDRLSERFTSQLSTFLGTLSRSSTTTVDGPIASLHARLDGEFYGTSLRPNATM
mmetsp:Transcript_25295/g.63445  ORF Transcript_25295/g.63445 Transcript_25295/m.63445 type:complete len:1134 (-) Transcript_25295:796-4197(-)